MVWLTAVAAGWGLYFRERRRHELDQRALQAALQGAVEKLKQMEPGPRPPGGPRVDPARLLRDVSALAFERDADADRARARGYIAHELTAQGWRPELMAFSEGINVLAERPGTDPTAGAVLLGAHYDTVPGTPGADDNASGVAVVLEAARLLRERPTARTLRLAFFDREERGMLGSRAYAQSDARLLDLRAVVVVEMAGFACRTPGCQRLPPGLPPGLAPDVGDFLAVVGDLEHVPLLAAFRQVGGPDLPPVVALPVAGRGAQLPDSRRSDHAPFWDRGVGAVMVTDTAELRNPHYHRPTDRPETLDPAFLTGTAQIVVDAVERLLGDR